MDIQQVASDVFSRQLLIMQMCAQGTPCVFGLTVVLILMYAWRLIGLHEVVVKLAVTH